MGEIMLMSADHLARNQMGFLDNPTGLDLTDDVENTIMDISKSLHYFPTNCTDKAQSSDTGIFSYFKKIRHQI